MEYSRLRHSEILFKFFARYRPNPARLLGAFIIFELFQFLAFTLFPHLSLAEPTLNGIALTKAGKQRKWDVLPVVLCLPPSLPKAARTALHGAVEVWNRDVGKEVFRANCVAKNSDVTKSDDHENAVFWVTSGFSKTGDSLALARTLSSFDEDTGRMTNADVLINADAFDWGKLKVDLQSVMIHELGHVLGLQHFFGSSISVMNQYPYQSGVVRRRLSSLELIAVRKLYFNGIQTLPAYIDPYFSGEFGLARARLRKSKSLTADEHYLDGYLALRLKQYSEAVSSFKNCLSLDPKNILARYRLAETYQIQSKAVESRQELEKLLRDSPRFYEALADLGALEFEQGKKDVAVELFKRTLEINPVHYPACIFLKSLTKSSQYDECIQKFAPND